ncbi:hypothetical protein [Marinoscillum furvescens]|nr:hypothetical protein [Marinoscillum furvescens]
MNEGQLLEDLIKESGMKFDTVAEKIGKSYHTLLRKRKLDRIDDDIWIKIGTILNIDISQHIPRLKKFVKNSYASNSNEALESRLNELELQVRTDSDDILFLKNRIADYDLMIEAKNEVIRQQSETIKRLEKELKKYR